MPVHSVRYTHRRTRDAITGEIQPVTCDHCGRQVPDAVFCTNCGAHQGLADHAIAAQERPHHFAAHPGEHVSQPSVFTTLFPHLGHRKLQEFRWALTLGFALVVVLVATGSSALGRSSPVVRPLS